MGRRLLLILVAAAVGVAAVVWIRSRTPDPEPFGLRIDRFEIDSELLQGPVEQIAVVPGRATGPAPLLVLLHGRGSSPEDMLSEELFAAIEQQGENAPVVLLPSSGEGSYWHDRATGRWATHLLDEVIPKATQRLDVDAHRVAIGGISMGGFGALHLGLETRFCAIGAHSPAIFASWEESSEGAFDDAGDFRQHDLLAAAEKPNYELTPVWIDIGTNDPFEPVVSKFAEELETGGADLTFNRWPGEHEDAYWRAHMDEYLDFYSAELERCRFS